MTEQENNSREPSLDELLGYIYFQKEGVIGDAHMKMLLNTPGGKSVLLLLMFKRTFESGEVVKVFIMTTAVHAQMIAAALQAAEPEKLEFFGFCLPPRDLLASMTSGKPKDNLR